MKIAIVPDPYKESLPATEIAQVIERGFWGIFPDTQYVSMPVADGGEGTVGAVITATQGTEHPTWVTGPLGEKVEVCWGMFGDSVIVFTEMTAASDLGLAPSEKHNPFIIASCDADELILQALEHGMKRIIIDIDGSATNGDGADIMQALDARLCDVEGRGTGHGGGSLSRLSRIDLSIIDPCLRDRMIHATYNVTNPLMSERGASWIFSPQKGATEAMIVELDHNLVHSADVTKASLWMDVKPTPGAGAAGGMGVALTTFLNAGLRSRTETVTEALRLEEQTHGCSLVVTGEGRIDSQSIHGKVPVGIARVAKKYRKSVIGIVGSLTHDVGVVHQHDIDMVFSVLTTASTLEEAFHGVPDNIYRVPRNITATLQIGMATEG